MKPVIKGDRGDEVVDIQLRLSKLGYAIGPSGADGSFGEATEDAVAQFQRNRKLAVTGVVDEKTWRALVEASYKLGERLLYLRSPFFRGDDVGELQTHLNTLGFNTGQVDGVYGETTERAVREFQRNVGLQSDGIFGPSTHAAIQNLRHLLTHEASCIYPDPNRNQSSALSIFENREIAIDLEVHRDAETLWCETDALEVGCDLGLRLGNLLELLGARVVYINEDTQWPADEAVELYIGFGVSASHNSDPCGSTILFSDADDTLAEKSKMLAATIQNEIIRSLDSKDLGVLPSKLPLKSAAGVPAILIKPLCCPNANDDPLLCEEIFRQKIAVAVFDGIKNYLQLC